MRKLVLVVAQETALRARIARLLQPAGYAVELAASKKRALDLVASEQLGAAIVAIDSSSEGLAFARQISGSVPGLIALAGHANDVARIVRSLPGVDAYVSTSFDEQRLLDRLAELTGQADEVPTQASLRVGDGRIDLAGRSFIHDDGREVALTRTETSLLMAFARSPGRVLSRDQLSQAITGHGAEPYGRSIDVQIGRLRRKIERNPAKPRFILTVSGAGYKFAASPQTTQHIRNTPTPAPTAQLQAEPDRLEGMISAAPEHARSSASAPAHSGPERRQLTVLACELVGSMNPAASVDPEDLASIVHRFQRQCATIVVSMGGSMASTSGREIQAVFGYPKAHEDDAERAVQAGLELRSKLNELMWPSGKPAQLRIGIATGIVVVGEQGVFGDASTIASHLKNVAQPDLILVAESTRGLLGRAFVCGAPAVYELSGIAEKVTACAVTETLAVESRFSSMRGPRLTQFVGRDRELQELLRRWKRAKAGDGQIVLLCGEAGIGKSRIGEVFLERIAAETHGVVRFQCAPQHASSPLYPLIGHLERAAGFTRGDTPDVKLDKLKAALSEAGTATLTDIRCCAAPLSIPGYGEAAPGINAAQAKDLTNAALVRYVLGLARKRPLVLELADAHWADSSTLDFFTRLIVSIKTASVLVLISVRPEFLPQWLDEPHVTMLRLDRLGREDIEAIVSDVTGQKLLPSDVHAQIVSKTDGVPLFAEELTKSVLESGLAQESGDRPVNSGSRPPFAIPTTLLGSLTARLDRLGTVKELAQIGAVIGREFSYRLLASVSPLSSPALNAALAQLAAPELIFVRGEPPEATYVFKHALVQDAAYSTLVRGKRQELHARIADALEREFPETVENQPELVAHHLIQAGLTERGLNYLRKAGRRAIEHSANAEAVRHLTQVRELLRTRPEGPGRTRAMLETEVMLSQAMIAGSGYAARETSEVLLRAKAYLDDMTDPSQKLAILYGVWACHYVGGEIAEQTGAAADFLAEARRHNDVASLCVAHRMMGTTYLTKGEFAAALPHLEESRKLSDQEDEALSQYHYGQDIGVAASCYLSWALWHLGYVDQASQVAADAVKRSDGLSHPHSKVFAICHARGIMDIFRRQSDDMRSYATSVISLCDQHSLAHWMAGGRILQGWAAAGDGEIEQGIKLLRSGIAAWQKAGAKLWLPLFFALEAEVCAKGGWYDDALQAIDRAIAFAERSGERWYLAEILRIKAELLRGSDKAAHRRQVETLLTRSLDLTRSQGARSLELRAASDLASLMQGEGRASEALKLLQSVYAQFSEGFETADMQRARLILNGLKPGDGLKQVQSKKPAP